MRQLLPVAVSAQVVTILPFKFFTVDSVKSAYCLATYGKTIGSTFYVEPAFVGRRL